MNRNYIVNYISNQKEIVELYNSFEVILVVLISNFNKNVKLIKVERNDFLNDESLNFDVL